MNISHTIRHSFAEKNCINVLPLYKQCKLCFKHLMDSYNPLLKFCNLSNIHSFDTSSKSETSFMNKSLKGHKFPIRISYQT